MFVRITRLFAPTRRRAMMLACAALFQLGGCVAPAQRSSIIDAIDSAEVTQYELDARMDDFLMECAVDLEAAALLNQRSVETRLERLACTQFTISIPMQLSRITLLDDPVAVLMDAWTFLLQLQAWFEVGTAHVVLGNAAPGIEATIVKLLAQIEEIALDAVGPETMQVAKKRVTEWASTRPIKTVFLARQSTAPNLVELVRKHSSDSGLLNSVETLEESVRDIAQRVAIMQSVMPRLIAWNFDILIDRWIGEFATEEMITRVDTALELAESIPSMVDEQRDIAVTMIKQEVDDVLATVDAQRLDTLAQIDTKIDEVVLRAVTLREETMVMLDERLSEIGGTIDDQRASITNDADRIVNQTLAAVDELRLQAITDVETIIDSTSSEISRAIMQAFRLALVLVVVALAGALGIVLISWRLGNGHRKAMLAAISAATAA